MRWTQERIEARKARALKELEICENLLLHVDDPIPDPWKQKEISNKATERALEAASMKDQGFTHKEIGVKFGVGVARAGQMVDRGRYLRKINPTPFDELPGMVRNSLFNFLAKKGLERTVENVLAIPLDEYAEYHNVGLGSVSTVKKFIARHTSD